MELLLQPEDLLLRGQDLLVEGLVVLEQVAVLLAGVAVGLVVALEGGLQGGDAALELVYELFVLPDGAGQAFCDAGVVVLVDHDGVHVWALAGGDFIGLAAGSPRTYRVQWRVFKGGVGVGGDYVV